jgi:Pyridine nucleotide-disulphide oxidoreductase
MLQVKRCCFRKSWRKDFMLLTIHFGQQEFSSSEHRDARGVRCGLRQWQELEEITTHLAGYYRRGQLRRVSSDVPHAVRPKSYARGARNDLRKSMSLYLCEQVVANPEIEVRYRTQLTAIEGTEHIGAVHLRDDDGNVAREETTGVHMFIGARPRTDFLPAELARDDKGFALTGSAVAKLESWKEQRPPEALETSVPGVFASGDCCSGTTKRVAFVIGDGALAGSCVHNFLSTFPT